MYTRWSGVGRNVRDQTYPKVLSTIADSVRWAEMVQKQINRSVDDPPVSPVPSIIGLELGSCDPVSGSAVMAKVLLSTPWGKREFTNCTLPCASRLNTPGRRQTTTGIVNLTQEETKLAIRER